MERESKWTGQLFWIFHLEIFIFDYMTDPISFGGQFLIFFLNHLCCFVSYNIYYFYCCEFIIWVYKHFLFYHGFILSYFRFLLLIEWKYLLSEVTWYLVMITEHLVNNVKILWIYNLRVWDCFLITKDKCLALTRVIRWDISRAHSKCLPHACMNYFKK